MQFRSDNMIKGSYDESYSKQKAWSQYFWVLRQLIYFGFLIGSNTQFSFIYQYLLERWLSVNWECHPDLLFGTTCLPDLSHSLILNKIFCFTVFFSCPVISSHRFHTILSPPFSLLSFQIQQHFCLLPPPVFHLLYTVSAEKRREVCACQRLCVCVFLQRRLLCRWERQRFFGAEDNWFSKWDNSNHQ